MIRSSNRFEQHAWPWVPCVLALLFACSTSTPATFPTTTVIEQDEPRRAPAVAVDPLPQLPTANRSAQVDVGVVALEQPIDHHSALRVVAAFFDAISREDLAALSELISEDAGVQLDPQTGRRRAREVWRTRFAQMPYDRLASSKVYREAAIEWSHAGEPFGSVARTGSDLPTERGDLVVRVPIATTSVDKDRLFGDEIVLVLRYRQGRLQVVEMSEPLQLK